MASELAAAEIPEDLTPLTALALQMEQEQSRPQSTVPMDFAAAPSAAETPINSQYALGHPGAAPSVATVQASDLRPRHRCPSIAQPRIPPPQSRLLRLHRLCLLLPFLIRRLRS